MAFEQLDDIYREIILDHRRHPRNRNPLERADISADGLNPFCGDEIHLQIKLDERGRIARVGLQAEGCAINQAAGSMLTEAIEGKTLQEIAAVADAFNEMMRGKAPSDKGRVRPDASGASPQQYRPRPASGERYSYRALPSDLETLSGVRQFPVRIKCALLAWDTLDEGIEEHRGGRPR